MVVLLLTAVIPLGEVALADSPDIETGISEITAHSITPQVDIMDMGGHDELEIWVEYNPASVGSLWRETDKVEVSAPSTVIPTIYEASEDVLESDYEYAYRVVVSPVGTDDEYKFPEPPDREKVYTSPEPDIEHLPITDVEKDSFTNRFEIVDLYEYSSDSDWWDDYDHLTGIHYIKESGDSWSNAIVESEFDIEGENVYAGDIVGLEPDTAYDRKVEIYKDENVGLDKREHLFTTDTDTVYTASLEAGEVEISSIYGEQIGYDTVEDVNAYVHSLGEYDSVDLRLEYQASGDTYYTEFATEYDVGVGEVDFGDVTGLDDGTTYSFRVVGHFHHSTEDSIEVRSDAELISTEELLSPEINILPAEDVEETSATLKAQLEDLESASSVTGTFYLYGDGVVGEVGTFTETDFDGDDIVDQDVDGLSQGSNYEFWVEYEYEIDGEFFTDETDTESFETKEIDVPTVATRSPTDVEAESATLRGDLIDLGQFDEVNVRFWYGEEGEDMDSTSRGTLTDDEVYFWEYVDDLKDDTTYEYEAEAIYEFEGDEYSVWGGTETFDTEGFQRPDFDGDVVEVFDDHVDVAVTIEDFNDFDSADVIVEYKDENTKWTDTMLEGVDVPQSKIYTVYDLVYETEYDFRFGVTPYRDGEEYDTVYTEWETHETLEEQLDPPTLNIATPVEVEEDSAMLRAYLLNTGDYDEVDTRFHYKIDGSGDDFETTDWDTYTEDYTTVLEEVDGLETGVDYEYYLEYEFGEETRTTDSMFFQTVDDTPGELSVWSDAEWSGYGDVFYNIDVVGDSIEVGEIEETIDGYNLVTDDLNFESYLGYGRDAQALKVSEEHNRFYWRTFEEAWSICLDDIDDFDQDDMEYYDSEIGGTLHLFTENYITISAEDDNEIYFNEFDDDGVYQGEMYVSDIPDAIGGVDYFIDNQDRETIIYGGDDRLMFFQEDDFENYESFDVGIDSEELLVAYDRNENRMIVGSNGGEFELYEGTGTIDSLEKVDSFSYDLTEDRIRQDTLAIYGDYLVFSDSNYGFGSGGKLVAFNHQTEEYDVYDEGVAEVHALDVDMDTGLFAVGVETEDNFVFDPEEGIIFSDGNAGYETAHISDNHLVWGSSNADLFEAETSIDDAYGTYETGVWDDLYEVETFITNFETEVSTPSDSSVEVEIGIDTTDNEEIDSWESLGQLSSGVSEWSYPEDELGEGYNYKVRFELYSASDGTSPSVDGFTLSVSDDLDEPSVTIGDLKDVSSTEATIEGVLTDTGDYSLEDIEGLVEIREHETDYWVTHHYDFDGSESLPHGFEKTFVDLEADTDYEYRVGAEVVGEDVTVYTDSEWFLSHEYELIDLSVLDPVDVMEESFTARVRIDDFGDFEFDEYEGLAVEIRTLDNDPVDALETNIESGDTPQTVELEVEENIEQGQGYEYRWYTAVDEVDGLVFSDWTEFETESFELPEASVLDIDPDMYEADYEFVTHDLGDYDYDYWSAVVGVRQEGQDDTDYYLTIPFFEDTEFPDVVEGTLTGLDDNTDYELVITMMSDDEDESFDADVESFTTEWDVGEFTIETDSARRVTDVSADIGGTLVDEGVYEVGNISHYINYRELGDTSWEQVEVGVIDDDTPISVEEQVDGLENDTTYEFEYLVAIDDEGDIKQEHGGVKEFTTASEEVVPPDEMIGRFFSEQVDLLRDFPDELEDLLGSEMVLLIGGLMIVGSFVFGFKSAGVVGAIVFGVVGTIIAGLWGFVPAFVPFVLVGGAFVWRMFG